MMSDVLNEGDIYRWRWADHKRDLDNAPYRSYHCFSQWAVVKGGRLLDTYWHGSGETEIKPSDVALEPVANIADLVKVREDEARYYSREDIVDMRHPNSTREPIYRRANAVRSPDVMMEVVSYIRERTHSEIRWATDRLADLEQAEQMISAGRLAEIHLPMLR